MSEQIYKKHNGSVLLYHPVCPTRISKSRKSRRMGTRNSKKYAKKSVCAPRIEFLEIGTDSDDVHFFVQSVPLDSPPRLVRTIKSITAKEIFRQMPEVKKQLWGGEFWSDGDDISTVGAHNSEEAVKQYVKNQGGGEHSSQPSLFF